MSATIHVPDIILVVNRADFATIFVLLLVFSTRVNCWNSVSVDRNGLLGRVISVQVDLAVISHPLFALLLSQMRMVLVIVEKCLFGRYFDASRDEVQAFVQRWPQFLILHSAHTTHTEGAHG